MKSEGDLEQVFVNYLQSGFSANTADTMSETLEWAGLADEGRALNSTDADSDGRCECGQ
jgi:hypothetical protein